jgi:hypothetical protein
MRSIVVLRRTDLDILTDLHILGAPECEKVVFEMRVCMCYSLVPEQLTDFDHTRYLRIYSSQVVWSIFQYNCNMAC